MMLTFKQRCTVYPVIIKLLKMIRMDMQFTALMPKRYCRPVRVKSKLRGAGAFLNHSIDCPHIHFSQRQNHVTLSPSLAWTRLWLLLGSFSLSLGNLQN